MFAIGLQNRACMCWVFARRLGSLGCVWDYGADAKRKGLQIKQECPGATLDIILIHGNQKVVLPLGI